MFFEMTYQIRVPDFKKGYKWYETFLKKASDFVPNEGFAEWEIVPGCWLQLAEGKPADASGPLRLAVKDILAEQERVIQDLKVKPFEIFSSPGVPVKWGTFTDPWGNRLGFFEYLDKEEESNRIKTILGED